MRGSDPPRQRWAIPVAVLVVWAVGLLLLLIELAPHWPSTTSGWLLLVVLGPPSYIASEAVGEWLLESLGRRFSSRR